MILVDSNAWIYLLDAGLKEHAAASTRLPALLANEETLIPTIVQMEVLHYVARQMGDDAGRVADAFLAFPGKVEPLTGGAVTRASRLLLQHRDRGVGGRDAALLAHARRTGARLVTADRALARAAEAAGIECVDPTR